jgi:hypothetical protein
MCSRCFSCHWLAGTLSHQHSVLHSQHRQQHACFYIWSSTHWHFAPLKCDSLSFCNVNFVSECTATLLAVVCVACGHVTRTAALSLSSDTSHRHNNQHAHANNIYSCTVLLDSTVLHALLPAVLCSSLSQPSKAASGSSCSRRSQQQHCAVCRSSADAACTQAAVQGSCAGHRQGHLWSAGAAWKHLLVAVLKVMREHKQPIVYDSKRLHD